MLLLRVSPTNRTNRAQLLLEFLTLRITLAENIFATFNSAPLSFRSDRSENSDSRSVVTNFVLKSAGDLDPESNLVWQKNYIFFEP